MQSGVRSGRLTPTSVNCSILLSSWANQLSCQFSSSGDDVESSLFSVRCFSRAVPTNIFFVEGSSLSSNYGLTRACLGQEEDGGFGHWGSAHNCSLDVHVRAILSSDYHISSAGKVQAASYRARAVQLLTSASVLVLFCKQVRLSTKTRKRLVLKSRLPAKLVRHTR